SRRRRTQIREHAAIVCRVGRPRYADDCAYSRIRLTLCASLQRASAHRSHCRDWTVPRNGIRTCERGGMAPTVWVRGRGGPLQHMSATPTASSNAFSAAFVPSSTGIEDEIVESVRAWGGSASITLLDPSCRTFKTPGIEGIVGYRL